MNLKQSLRVLPGECVAFTGSGGKTTALFTLARELEAPVLVTTSTHFGLEQISLADENLRVDPSTDINDLIDEIKEGVLILRGDMDEENRVSGIPEDKLEEVYLAAQKLGIPLLIEADGSRQLPLKAPASHEPVIPHVVDRVVVVAGLSALGKPLSDKWVHRVDQFSELSGLDQGEPISPRAIINVLKDPEGGRKGIPPGAKRLVLLNQADDLQRQAQGNRIAKRLLAYYDSVIVASLASTNERINTIQPDRPIHGGEIFAAHEHVAAVILSAGESSRMGRTKQLLPWKGKPLLWHAAQAAVGVEIEDVIIVVGSHGEQIKKSLNDLNVKIVENPDWQLGQSTSIQAGLRAMPDKTGAVIFLLADQPRISAALVRALIEKHAKTLAPIIAPLVDGTRGNPVLFDRITFDDLMKIEGDTGGRELFSHYTVEWLEWHDAGALIDIDTDDDYQQLLGGEF
jgi:molybdenum cofactor cytidylyltransferase